MKVHDVIVVGAGNNGLTAAAYLAKAGLDVLVLEANKWIGGGCITQEPLLPGFKFDMMAGFPLVSSVSPTILQDELGLISKYGLEYIFMDPGHSLLFPDDSYISLWKDMDRTCEDIAKFSPKDAENYRRLIEFGKPLQELMGMGAFTAPPPFGKFMNLLGDSREGREISRMLMLSAADLLDEWFESEKLKSALINDACESLTNPFAPGGAMMLTQVLGGNHAVGSPVVSGGIGRITELLGQCIKENGGTIQVNSKVTKLSVTGGKIDKVTLSTGEEIRAKRAVLSNLNIRQIPALLGDALDSNISSDIKRIKPSDHVAFVTHFAINEPPRYKASDDIGRSIVRTCSDSLKETVMRYVDLKFGGWPGAKEIFMASHTVWDPSRAPEGKHTLWLCTFVPPRPVINGKEQSWDDLKEKVADEMLELLQKHTTNMGPENILGRFILSPKDIERLNPSMIDGDWHHISADVAQLLANRPLPELGHYKTPIDGFYICGASTHPGGGVTLASGRASAMVIMEDLDIDFDNVITS